MTSRRVILATNHLEEQPRGGREMLCRLNHDVLRQLFAGDLLVVQLDVNLNPRPSLGGMRELIRGHINGVNDASLNEVVRLVDSDPRPTTLFVDGSNLGALAAAAKRRRPSLEVISFFHNVESKFFLGSALRQKSFRSIAVLLANYAAETRAVRYSDKRICLSARDSQLLGRLYGRPGSHVSALAVKDRYDPDPPQTSALEESFALFVGGAFYANRQAVEWYATEIAPKVGIKVIVVGRGLEGLRIRMEVPGKVQVLGAVDNLGEWYGRAQFVIAPILDGSGMKTKVAEALMHGKKVVGTPEAFSGYEEVLPHAGWQCRDANAFADAMQVAAEECSAGMDLRVRALYEQHYSEAAARVRLSAILADTSAR